MNGMNDNGRIHRYLAARADAIVLPPREPAAIVARAQRRQHRRRAAAVGSLAVVALAIAGVAMIRDSGDDDLVEARSENTGGVVESPLDWQVVEPEIGLGLYTTTVASGEGAVYSLSTAPGPMGANVNPVEDPARLYRSSDGAEWEELALPDDLWAYSLSESGGRLYAVGTAPAGGSGRDVVVAASDDGGDSWSDPLPLPLDDLAMLAATGAPEEVVLGQPVVAAGPAGVVVAVVVQYQPDVLRLAREAGVDIDSDAGFSSSADGVEVYDANVMSPEREPEVAATYTWDELGLDPVLREFVGGRPYVFASPDGEAFQPVSLPGIEQASNPRLLATADGFTLLLQRWGMGGDAVRALRSTDGLAWERDPFGEMSGYLAGAGLLDGRPAVVLSPTDPSGIPTLWVASDDGTWSTVDLGAALDEERRSRELWFGSVAFGPLGVAAVVGDPGDAVLLHSLDGSTVSAVPLDEYFPRNTAELAVTVSADAIVVRANEVDGNPNTAPRQLALVGTPRG